MNRLGSLSTRRIVSSFGRTSSLSTTLGRSYINHPATTIIGSSFQQISVRSFSDGNVPGSLPSGENAVSDAVTTAASNVTESIQSAATDAAVAVTTAPADINFVVRGVMDMIDSIHNFVGIPYWEAIVVTTIGLRVFLLPVAIKTIQGSARMAVMRPAMQKLQDRMNADPNIGDMNTKLRYQNEMKAMFLKFKVNPLRAVMWPFVQFPVFIAFFLALKEMGTVFPGFADGGAFWFQNLAAADPLYILPIFNSLSFLIMIEMGADGVQMQQQQTFKMVMRGLAVGMVPVTISMPAVSWF
jgi:YidC/Oxa1 family membrane protein insertase